MDILANLVLSGDALLKWFVYSKDDFREVLQESNSNRILELKNYILDYVLHILNEI